MLKRYSPLILLVAACWAVFVLNNVVLGGSLGQYGIVPRRLGGLPAILWAPWLHGSFKHLLANSVPLVILGGIICSRGKAEFVAVTAAGVLVTGALTWVFARSASHIGASGLVFCWFGYLTSLAYFRRTFGTLLLSAVCLLVYGGMLRGLLPTSAAISWEGHLAGLLAGILLAGMLSNRTRSETGLASDGDSPFGRVP